jgi:hypothetical protein
MFTPRRVIALAALIGAVGIVQAADARAFTVNIHEQITGAGLTAPGDPASFIGPGVLGDIEDQHEQVDGGLSGARDERHFDDCEFDGAAKYIRDRFAGARTALAGGRVWDATDQFGNALHPVMDVYSHSNWVEMGFPRSDDPDTARIEVRQSDLLDLSGAQDSLAEPWHAPGGGGVVRGDIRLGRDDWNIPLGWRIRSDGGGRHVPTLIDPDGRTRGRLLVTGEGTLDDECDVYFQGTTIRAFNGFEHHVLHKDDPSRRGHARARALATLQTGYEWCRLVREAGQAQRDGLLLATWVKAGGIPHPANTPCAKASAGPVPIVVTVDSVRVLDSGDDDNNEPGEIQLATALYDDPANFRRSVHAVNPGGVTRLDDGQRFPSSRLPRQMRLCVRSGATFALHGWDNDDDAGDRFADDFDDVGDDDELLVGFQRRFGNTLPAGQQIARSADLEVRYRVSRDTGDPTFLCPQLPVPTDG